LDRIETAVMTYMDGLASPAPIARDTALLEAGVLDSIELVRLIQFLEREFSITIADTEVGADIFASPAAIAEFVARKLG
jgi:acyl carrier protein